MGTIDIRRGSHGLVVMTKVSDTFSPSSILGGSYILSEHDWFMQQTVDLSYPSSSLGERNPAPYINSANIVD